ncbi:hypothetical protein HPB50_019692 [Hyalomma asiaticum]|uniref:Uncharacterized protein n=1 Tax=Hyalomma asiaticum TaxID=266040 RepID=A0ACB7SAK7_HYAAI|nr:hypothetical protein HPB50_019692 [Hyalomma asiaticum]
MLTFEKASEPEALVQLNMVLHQSPAQHLLPNPTLVYSLYLHQHGSIANGHPVLQLAAPTVAVSTLLLGTGPHAARFATIVPRGDILPQCAAVTPSCGHPVPSGLRRSDHVESMALSDTQLDLWTPGFYTGVEARASVWKPHWMGVPALISSHKGSQAAGLWGTAPSEADENCDTGKEGGTQTHATENGAAPPSVPSAVPLCGKLEPFEGEESTWPVYKQQTHMFFRAIVMPEARQRDIFLASCRTCVFSLLLALLKLAMPQDKTLSFDSQQAWLDEA